MCFIRTCKYHSLPSYYGFKIVWTLIRQTQCYNIKLFYWKFIIKKLLNMSLLSWGSVSFWPKLTSFFTNLILPKLFLKAGNRFVSYVAGICHSAWQFIKYFCENVKTATSLHSLLNPTVNLRKPDLKYCCWILQILHIWTSSLKWLIFWFGCCFKNKLQSELFLGSTKVILISLFLQFVSDLIFKALSLL